MKHNAPWLVALTLAAACVANPASAHHSYAMFDRSREIVLKDATVVGWEWTSPHTWLYVLVPAPGREPIKYSIEGGNPGILRRQGFGKGSLSPGDKITVYIAPLKSGDKGGALNAVALKTGAVLGERAKIGQ